MYQDYFGLREKPFKLVPNPEYLFLSKSHEIALAHLTYAVEQGEGFVVITGEVGTGKTTLCRLFMEQLQGQAESAYIFNPRLDSIQLLGNICNELGIRTKAKTLKAILDVLNVFLMEQRKKDHKVVLLIDEAQGLSVENLEMVRMLSNLETTRNKLLQIILVGQPELSDLLDSYELRQLAQRISLNCHLSPLTAVETKAYIQHRVAIAAKQPIELFSAGAGHTIYRYSGGIPRLINIACDRALLAAYSLNRTMVTKSIMRPVLRELTSRGRQAGRRPARIGLILGCMLIPALLGAAFFIYENRWFELSSESGPAGGRENRPTQSVPASGPPVQSFKVPGSVPPRSTPAGKVLSESSPSAAFEETASLVDAIAAIDPQSSRTSAASALLSLWKQPQFNPDILPPTADDETFFNLAARLYGLRSHTVQQDLELVRQLNLPAIVAFKHIHHDKGVYLVLKKWRKGRIQLVGSDLDTVETDIEGIRPHLKGPIFIFWKNILGYDFIIGHGAQPKAVLAVKNLLHQAGYPQIALTPQFDKDTQQAIIDFQSRHKLVSDGLVGSLTKIMLIQSTRVDKGPQLNSDKGAGA